MSWYEYSRHATSVLVYYLRGYDHILQRLDARGLLDAMALGPLVEFTNALYDAWPMRTVGRECESSPHEFSGHTLNGYSPGREDDVYRS